MSKELDNYYSLKEAADILKVSTKTVRRRIQAGELQAELMDGPYGEQYFLPKEQFNTATQIVDVVTLKKEYDLKELALSLSNYFSERDDKLLQEISNIKEEMQKEHAKAIDTLRLEFEIESEKREQSIRDNIKIENQTLMAKLQEMRDEDRKSRSIFSRVFKKYNN